MTTAWMQLRRRLFLAGIGGFALNLPAHPARAATGIAAIDTPAIAVKNPSGVLLVAITMTASKRLVAAGEHGVIIFSDDNGTTWKQASVPVIVTLTAVAFATPMIGWAAGHFGVILNTADGGKTWQLQLNGIQADQLTMQAAQDPSLASNPSPGAPLAEIRAEHFMQEGPDKPFLTLLLLGPQKLIAFGAYRMTMMSSDGGRTWVDWSLHIYDKYSHNFYDTAMIGTTIYLVGEEGYVFSSTDGANTFLPLTSPSGISLFGVLGPRDGSVLVFGVVGAAYRSTNGGKSWTQINISSQQDLTAGRVLADGTVVLVDEAGGLYVSANNGVTFRSVQGVPRAPFFDIQQASDGSLVAAGAKGITIISQSLLQA